MAEEAALAVLGATNPLLAIGVAIIGGIVQSRAAKKARQAKERAAEAAIAEQREARDQFVERTEPFRQLGLSAISPISDLLGLDVGGADAQNINQQIADIDAELAMPLPSPLEPQAFDPTARTPRFGGPSVGISESINIENQEAESNRRAQLEEQKEALMAQLNAIPPVTEGGADRTTFAGQEQFLSEINPLVSFLRDEGFEQIQELAASRGRLGAGGTLKDLTRFNTQLASTIVPQLQSQRFNELFNLINQGGNIAVGQGTTGVNVAGNIGNALGSIGTAQAQGAIRQSNIITGGLEDAGSAISFEQARRRQAGEGGLFDFLMPPPSVGGIQNPNRFASFS